MPTFFWLEVSSFLVGIVCWVYLRTTYLKWFVPFLFLIVLVEISGRFLPKVLHLHNAWLFNFSVPLEYLFYTFIYWHTYDSFFFKKIAKSAGLMYSLFCLAILVINGIPIFQNLILTVGNLLAIMYSCIYFYETLKKDKVINFRIEPMFWITCGVFLFNLGELTYTLFRPIITANRWDVTLVVFKSINNTLIFWLYGLIIIGLLCTVKNSYRKISG
jgi:hypothetical protein